jgi:Uma2 family endonuclease
MTELTFEAIAPPAPPGEARRWSATYEEYLAWPDESALVEWNNGEIIEYIPPTDHHQDITGSLFNLISDLVRLQEVGVVRVAPFEVKLWPDGPSREPDVLFISRDRLDQLTPQRFEGGPDLVIEIVSSSSARADRAEKFIEYEQAGVREYWLIDPREGKEQADFYQLDTTGRFVSVPLDAAGLYHSAVLPGLTLDPTMLRAAELPNPQLLLAGIAKDLPTLPDNVRAAYRALYDALSRGRS